MAEFNAADVVGKLDWTFRPHVDASGTVPEPSTEKVGAFFSQLSDLLDRPDDEHIDQVVSVLASMSVDQMTLIDDKLLATYADLCSDCPTADQMRALPHRQRQAFFGWITGQVTNPT